MQFNIYKKKRKKKTGAVGIYKQICIRERCMDCKVDDICLDRSAGWFGYFLYKIEVGYLFTPHKSNI